MQIRCPHCKTDHRVKEPGTAHVRMATVTCPCCGGSIKMGPLPPPRKTGESPEASTRCAILSTGNRLRLFDIARRTKPKPESLS